MTHLETYIDCLKLLPGDFARDMQLMHTLDLRGQSLQHQLRAKEEQLMALFSDASHDVQSAHAEHGDELAPHWVNVTRELRSLQSAAHALALEKVALCKAVRESIVSYSHRLDDETALFEKEMGPEFIREALEADTRKRATFGLKGQRGRPSFSSKAGDRAYAHRERERDRLRLQAAEDDIGLDAFDVDVNLNDDAMLHGDFTVDALGDLDDSAMMDIDSRSVSVSASQSHSGSGEEVYCFCRMPSFGEMIACDDPNCKYEWFHFTCVGLKKKPKNQWFCQDCRKKQKQP